MNILPHKRSRIAEREHRLSVLRQRAKQRQTGVETTKDEQLEDNSNQDMSIQTVKNTDSIQGHINFWADIEKESLAVVSTNPEYEAEKKAKEKKWEKQFTMYLGDVVKEQKPWYTRVESEFEKQYKEEHTKMRAHEKREKRDRSSNGSNSEAQSTSSIEKLRAERLAREKKEHLRVQKLLNPNLVADSGSTGRYNSQFNPDATKAAHELSELSSLDNSDKYNNRYRSRRYRPY
ncbi:10015_t:CDS:2 [Rhizophagus irregularis]|nr:10015_t:CDS:2 [Rhizophagus irregularis]